MYIRKCDLTGKQILSQYPEGSPYKAYFHDAWYSDKWNGKDFGRPYDFNRSFFEQFSELLLEVPKLALNVVNVQNCDYLNQCGYSKNCYFTIEADENQDCMYGYRVFYNKTCSDFLETVHSERCYEVTDCDRCFQLRYSQLCEQCRDSAFLFDCRSCNNCFGCTGLRQKSYCMFNEQLRKEEYEERMKMFDFCNREHLAAAAAQLMQLKLQHPRKAFIGEQNENVMGNYIYESKDCFDSYGLRGCRDCKYCNLIRDSKDCMDYFVWGAKAERIYESQCCGVNLNNLRFCCNCWDGVHDLTYCFECVLTSTHCFGCTGLQKAEYCILNKQYRKQEYEELVPRIIEHMKTTNEWGEFFPVERSPYAYNETPAQEYYPLEKDEVLKKGWRWKDDLPFTKGKETIAQDKIPDRIEDVQDSIMNEVLACEATGKNYRITKQELLLYRAFRVPIPRLHPDERHSLRMALRNPRKLWDRKCQKCGVEIKTSYSPVRPEIVYCEKCYLQTVY